MNCPYNWKRVRRECTVTIACLLFMICLIPCFYHEIKIWTKPLLFFVGSLHCSFTFFTCKFVTSLSVLIKSEKIRQYGGQPNPWALVQFLHMNYFPHQHGHGQLDQLLTVIIPFVVPHMPPGPIALLHLFQGVYLPNTRRGMTR